MESACCRTWSRIWVRPETIWSYCDLCSAWGVKALLWDWSQAMTASMVFASCGISPNAYSLMGRPISSDNAENTAVVSQGAVLVFFCVGSGVVGDESVFVHASEAASFAVNDY